MKAKTLFFIIILLIIAMLPISFAQDNTQVGLPEGAIARFGKGGINIMRFSPDGTRLAVGTDINVRLYDVPNRKGTVLFTERGGQVNALAFSPDGKFLASGGLNDPIIQLWNVDNGSKHAILSSTGSFNSIAALAFTQDSTTLISLSSDEFARWDVSTGNKVSKSRGISEYESVVFSEDGSSLAIGTREGRIRLWDATKGRQRKSLKGHAIVSLLKKENADVEVWALAFSPDGKMLASGSEDKTVQLWDIEKRTKLATLDAHGGWITAVAFSADGKTLASGDANKVIKLWDVDTHKERGTLLGHKNTISALTFAPEGKSLYSGCLASGSADGTIRFWDPKNGEELITFTSGHTESVKAVAFSEDDANLAIAGFNGAVDLWNLQTGDELITFDDQHSDMNSPIALAPAATRLGSQAHEGSIMFSPHFDGSASSVSILSSIQLGNIITGEKISGPWQAAGRITGLTFSLDNNILAADIGNEGILVWHVNTGVELFRFQTGSPHGSKLTFSANGKLFATNGTFVKTQVWDITTQSTLTPPDMEEHSALAFSPDSTTLALGDTKGISLWNVTPAGIQERGRITDKHRGFDGMLIFSPDGKILLDARWAGIELWDTSGNDLGTLAGHTKKITTLVFSHNGKTLASGGDDGTVLLWDWDKILEKTGKDDHTNLKPSEKQAEDANKSEEAEVILNWLEKHSYQVKKLGETILITQGKSRTFILGSSGIPTSTGTLEFTLDRTRSILQIDVKNVGTAVFGFDEKGDLKYEDSNDEN